MVQILMSTYNGQKYLIEQIESLLAQTYREIRILVRDDGSVDGTTDILKKYAQDYSSIEWYRGKNIGVKDSFFDLLKHVDEKADYIAFCDQDDVWLQSKIEVAVNQLKKYHGAAMYCGNTILTDEQLKPLKKTLQITEPRLAFGNAIIQNVCVGCTMVINRQLYDIFMQQSFEYAVIHDWLFYQLATAFGEVYYDSNSYIYYRQHSGNAIGIDSGRKNLVARQLKSFSKFRGKFTLQANELCKMKMLSDEKKRLANMVAGTSKSIEPELGRRIQNRINLFFDRQIFRQGKFDNLLFKCMFLAGVL